MAAALGEAALIGAGLGFVTRDVALFVLLHALPGRRRGDFTALLALFALYLLIPSILNGLGPRRCAGVLLSQAIRSGVAGAGLCLGRGGGCRRRWPSGRIALGGKPQSEALAA